MSESEPLPGPWIVDEPNAGLSIYGLSAQEALRKMRDQLDFDPTMGPIFELGITETPRTTSSGISGGNLLSFNLCTA